MKEPAQDILQRAGMQPRGAPRQVRAIRRVDPPEQLETERLVSVERGEDGVLAKAVLSS